MAATVNEVLQTDRIEPTNCSIKPNDNMNANTTEDANGTKVVPVEQNVLSAVEANPEIASIKTSPKSIDSPLEGSAGAEEISSVRPSETQPNGRSNGRSEGYKYADRKHKGNTSYKHNIKSRYDGLKESSDPREIRAQVDFYFSDANLPFDKFLLESTAGHQNLPFDLKKIHSFARMRHFQPYSAVFDAMKESTLLDISDDGMLTRKIALSDKYGSDIDKNRDIHEEIALPRTVYAKGFGREDEHTQTDLETFFQTYGMFSAVRLRRNHFKKFKGSVFVEWVDEKTAEDFLALADKLRYHEDDHEPLLIKSKKVYMAEKLAMANAREDKDSASGRHTDRDDWKQRRADDQRSGRNGRGGNDRGGRGRNAGGRDRHGKDSRHKLDGDKGGRSSHRNDRDSKDKDESSNGDVLDKDIEVKKEDEAAAAEQLKAEASVAEIKTESVPVEPESKKRAREDDTAGEAESTEVKKIKSEA